MVRCAVSMSVTALLLSRFHLECVCMCSTHVNFFFVQGSLNTASLVSADCLQQQILHLGTGVLLLPAAVFVPLSIVLAASLSGALVHYRLAI